MGLGGPLGQTYHFGRTVSVKCFLNQNPYVDAFDGRKTYHFGDPEKIRNVGAFLALSSRASQASSCTAWLHAGSIHALVVLRVQPKCFPFATWPKSPREG